MGRFINNVKLGGGSRSDLKSGASYFKGPFRAFGLGGAGNRKITERGRQAQKGWEALV